MVKRDVIRLNMIEMKKHIQPMPKCLDRECVNGVVTQKINGSIVQKLCKKCEKIEKDLEESDDYVVYYQNGRVVGYELIEK